MKHDRCQPFFSLITSKDTQYHSYPSSSMDRFYRNLVRIGRSQSRWQPWLFGVHRAACLTIPAVGLTAMGLSWLTTGSSFWLLNSIGLAIGGVGTFLGIKHNHQFKTIVAHENYLAHMDSQEPPTVGHPWTHSRRLTFNQLTSFYCDEVGQLWYALRESTLLKPDWKPLYIPDWPKNVNNVELKADGPNFMVKVGMGEQAQIFYKKVFKDKRESSSYHVTDLCPSPDSESQWFSLPVVSWFMTSQWGKRLVLGTKSLWAMTHSGTLKHQMPDAKGKLFDIWGVTTVFEQTKEGVKLYDPYVPRDLEIIVSLPPDFCVQAIDGTSSHLFLLGYDRTDPDLKPCLLERTLDYDTLGLNPLINYTKDKYAKGRLMPLSEWRSIALPHKPYDWALSVIHPGKGFLPEIRLRALEPQKGEKGFYYKQQGSKRWHYYQDQTILDEPLMGQERPLARQAFRLKEGRLYGQTLTSAYLDHFDLNLMQAKLTLKDNQGQMVKCYLYRHTNLIRDFLKGSNQFSWTLALTQESQTADNRQWFKAHEGAAVKISLEDGCLKLESKEIRLEFERERQGFQVWHYPQQESPNKLKNFKDEELPLSLASFKAGLRLSSL